MCSPLARNCFVALKYPFPWDAPTAGVIPLLIPIPTKRKIANIVFANAQEASGKAPKLPIITESATDAIM